MKILIDPVYTGKAHKCSTSYLAWKIIEGLIEWRDDIFFYLLYPEASESNEEEMAFLKRHTDRVKLFSYPYIQADRVEEMFKLHDRMIHLLSPGDTPIWDYDVVLSSRIPQLPFMRNVSGREAANFPHGTQRLFVGLEEMPIFKFRDTVSWAPGGNMDLQSLAAYQSAGAVIINNLWTKAAIQQVARRWLSPSNVIEISKGIHEAVPVKLERLQIAPKVPGDTLNVVFAGRMTGTRNFKEVAEIFRKHFSYPLSKKRKVRFIVSTNSQSTGSVNVGEIDFMEFQYNNREQFHDLLKNEAHVVVNLSTVEDFSLSTYEPLLFGVPVVVPNADWAGFLGPVYPFIADQHSDAYNIVREFVNHYEDQYARFAKWEATYWAEHAVAGPRNVSTTEVVKKLLTDYEKMINDKLDASEGGATYKMLVEELAKLPGDTVEPLKYANTREPPYFVTNAKQWRGIPVGKRPCQHLLKVYANRAGYRDTNEPGVMLKPKEGK